MAVVGAVIGAVGSVMQGMAGAASANYQAQVAKNNQIIAEQNADYAQQVGLREEEAFNVKASQVLASQAAAQGASGFDMAVGTPRFVRRGSKMLAKLDALTIRSNTEREVQGFEAQATNYAAEAGLRKMEASNASLSGFLGAASSLVGAVGSVAGKWSGYRSPAQTQTVYGPTLASKPVVPVLAPQPGLSSPMVPARYGASAAYV